MGRTPMTELTVYADIPKDRRHVVRVAHTEYQGVQSVDLRLLYPAAGGEMKQTRKGVSLRVDRLPALLDALRAAEADLRAKGLLGGEE